MAKLLFLTAYPIEDASCRYRVHQFVPWLERAGHQCTIVPFASRRLFHELRQNGRLMSKVVETSRCAIRRLAWLPKVGNFDIVVIHREAFPFFTPAVENLVLRRAHKSVFSFDDAIYAGHDDLSGGGSSWLYRWKHGAGYDRVIAQCDHVIAGNSILAAHAQPLNRNVSVIPTVVDCSQYRPKLAQPEPWQPLTIGWMGSSSTAPHLERIEPTLRRLAEEYPGRVRFRFFGAPEYSPKIPGCYSLPFRLSREMHDLHSLDIGLMPASDTAWTRGKCAFKAIQYMASGVATVASPVGITPELVRDGVNGFLARSLDDWYDALNYLVRNPGARQRIATAARLTVETKYSLSIWAPRLVELFNQLVGSPSVGQREQVAA